MKRLILATGIAAAMALSACSSSGTSAETSAPASPTASFSMPASSAAPDPVSSPSEEASDPVVDDTESATPSPSSTFTELAFGDPLSVAMDDGAGTATVTLGKPSLAKCQYQSIGCDKPETGDRVVQVPVLIQNTGTESMSWSASDFVLEFDDGTQMEASDGAAIDYQPDNAMGYDHKIRPNSKYKTVLVFEAPKGPFKVLILTSPFDGEPFAAWG